MLNVYNCSHLLDVIDCVSNPAGANPQYTSSPHSVSVFETGVVDGTLVAAPCTVGAAGCSIVGVTVGGVEAVFVHPPTRTNPIPHKMRMRRGSFIQENTILI
jgi:hypothetical protein